MNFKKTTTYSLSILSFMADNPDTKYSAGKLHKSLDIPYQYLRQLLTNLSKNGFISGSRGKKGGFVLCKGTEKIYLSDIVNCTEGSEIFSRCIMGYETCPFDHVCPMHEIWSGTRENLERILKNTSLKELINNKKRLE